MLDRRQLLILTGAGMTGAALASCAQDPDNGSGGSGDSLRMYWWGADIRNQLTEEAIAVFGEQEPDIGVDLEWGEWGTYWDRLATTAAGGDMPDVLQMDEAYIDSYGSRDALLDLETTDVLDLSGMDEAVLETGRLADGTLVGAPVGVGIFSVGVNPTILADAGVEVPDDTIWTWESFGELSAQISTALQDEAVLGFDFFGLSSAEIGAYARQVGEHIFPREDEDPLTKATIVEFLDYSRWLIDIGACPDVSEQIEDFNAGVDQSRFATNRCAFHLQFHTQIQAFAAGSGEPLELMRLPALTPGEARMVNKASMYWSIAASTDSPQEAATLVNFLLTDPEAARILEVERGVTAIPDVQDVIEPELDDIGRISLDFARDLQAEVVTPPMVTPASGVDFGDEFRRLASEALFDQASHDDVADSILDALAQMQPDD